MQHSLQFRLSQQLTMTPQLQQAMRLLPLSAIELQQEIQLAVESNPFLETVDPFNQSEIVGSEQNHDDLSTSELFEQQRIHEELLFDTPWDEIYPNSNENIHYDEYSPYEGKTNETLHSYLLWQINLTPFSATDAAIATVIVEGIDDSGYLTVPLTEIAEELNTHDEKVTLTDIEIVLKRLQHFDPPGVAARDLRECLLIQLNQLKPPPLMLASATLLVHDYLPLLYKQDVRTLVRESQLDETHVKAALQLIRSLTPRPGDKINNNQSTYIIPDVIVHKINQQWVVELNSATVPQLQINPIYSALNSNDYSERDGHYLREQLQQAKWWIKSLANRHETLLKVARCLVDAQKEFFENGIESIKPLIMADIAQQIDLHESTISRITTQKYLHSPQGIFELKYFFSSQLNTEKGDEVSSTAVRALLKKRIATENPDKPLSDSQLVSLLAEKGIIVARRTIAKYRDLLRIPPSSQRKKRL